MTFQRIQLLNYEPESHGEMTSNSTRKKPNNSTKCLQLPSSSHDISPFHKHKPNTRNFQPQFATKNPRKNSTNSASSPSHSKKNQTPSAIHRRRHKKFQRVPSAIGLANGMVDTCTLCTLGILCMFGMLWPGATEPTYTGRNPQARSMRRGRGREAGEAAAALRPWREAKYCARNLALALPSTRLCRSRFRVFELWHSPGRELCNSTLKTLLSSLPPLPFPGFVAKTTTRRFLSLNESHLLVSKFLKPTISTLWLKL